MTRIKKRRTGKKRTEDQLRLAAGRRRARKAANPEPAKEQGPKVELTAEQKAAYKKSFQPAQAGRRNRAASKGSFNKKEDNKSTSKPDNKKAPVAGKTSGKAGGKTTGKTRSAGARRIAVAKSVAGNGKVIHKKTTAPKTAAPAEGKSPKGFAPWNKNKFKKKFKGE